MSDIKHKPLETEFRRDGFDYRMIQREGDVAIFEQSKPKIKQTWLEVIIVQRHNGYEIAGNKIEPAETYPPTSTWGRLGWTFRNSIPAVAKLEELVAARK